MMRWVRDKFGRGRARLLAMIDGVEVIFGPAEITVFAELFNARGRRVTKAELVDAMYGHRADGGANNTDRMIYSEMNHLRRKLAATRFRIVNNHSLGYRLERLPAKCSPKSGG